MFDMQLLPLFAAFLLNVLLNFLWGGQRLFNKRKIYFPTFVSTFGLCGGLNRVISLFCFSIVLVFCYCLNAIDFGSCLINDGQFLDSLLTQILIF